jgi:hypothetical protein
MSPLLAFAIVLLVLVVGLTLLQRRGETQSYQARREPLSPPTVPDPSDPTLPPDPPPTDTETKADPLLGTIGYYDDRWMTEDDLNLHGSLVMAEIVGTIDGPTNADHEIVRAALARPDLEGRGRALVISELERRGEDTSGLMLLSLSVRPDDSGVLHGFLWYDPGEFLGEIGVKSSNHWQTIHVVVEE